jgi:hypothetical protein
MHGDKGSGTDRHGDTKFKPVLNVCLSRRLDGRLYCNGSDPTVQTLSDPIKVERLFTLGSDTRWTQSDRTLDGPKASRRNGLKSANSGRSDCLKTCL